MPVPKLVRAWLDSPSTAIIEFESDWSDPAPPPLGLSSGAPPIAGLAPAPGLASGRRYGYFAPSPGEWAFVLPLEHGCDVDPVREQVYVAGDFNGWQPTATGDDWLLRPAELEGERVLIWTGPAAKVGGPCRFKFVTGENLWLSLPNDAPNAARDEQGNFNRKFDPSCSGSQLWRATFIVPLDLAEVFTVSANPSPDAVRVTLMPGAFFYELKTDLPLGAQVGADETVFRLFAPRARSVMLHVCETLAGQDEAHSFPLERRSGAGGAAVWEVVLDQNLHRWFYWYTVDGAKDGAEGFDPAMRILDPYALATVDRGGPGIILDRAWIGSGDRGLSTPAWHELVIAEAHVRDLAANAPVTATPIERRGFVGLRKWVESPEFHLHQLGVNCVELQPVQEFDNRTADEYHWGYMPNNYFAPESSYSLAPEQASGVREFQELVAAFHRRGMAVLLDVVYNHMGEPAHLFFLDRLYYFEHDSAGRLTNWSGCGNDSRARSAMMRRLIVDSCIHMIEAYGVDGFRFDLADLLGVEALVEIETALKRVKPDVVLIAEPWSFRGHIAGALRDTGWASWNDGYRDFVREYVFGRGSAERLEYFMRGSPWYFAKWPAQTVNYTESHDDRTWIDAITENPGCDGTAPTANDRRRTHLMAAILFMSVGIPMVAAGQDFLRSKGGVTNTYQRGDLNALDYKRLYRYLSTHNYFADWIAFRLGEDGRLLRHFSRPGEGFFQFFRDDGSPALAVLVNADRSAGPLRLLFAVNPSLEDRTISVGDAVTKSSGNWRQLADHERFYDLGSHGAHAPVEAGLFLPALGCALWASR